MNQIERVKAYWDGFHDELTFYEECTITGIRRRIPVKRQPKVIPAGARPLYEPKPRAHYYHYSNPASQGALICQTRDFPGYIMPNEKCEVQYSDRIIGWDYGRFKEACEIAGGGDGVWSSRLPMLTDDRLKEFAKVALGLSVTPKHVRVVHHFNASSGYSCPTIEAIYEEEASAVSGLPDNEA